jgi:hypothetical protein
VQHLPGVGTCGEDRVIPQQLRVPVGGALLQTAAHLTDEAVDIDHQPFLPGTGTGTPRPEKRLSEQRIELAHVPEGEHAHERPNRRGRRYQATQQPSGTAGPQDLAVVDAVRAGASASRRSH